MPNYNINKFNSYKLNIQYMNKNKYIIVLMAPKIIFVH